MDNSKTNLPESDAESEPEPEPNPEPNSEPQDVPQQAPETESNIYVNERIKKAFDRVKLKISDAKDYYKGSPRLQKVAYQGKYLPAFWTVACIFSLIVNVILISMLVSFGHHFFELKNLLSSGLVEASNSLVLMDKAHIVDSVPFSTTVQVQDTLPVVFDLEISQNTQLLLAQETQITGATIYLNNAAVTTDLTLPAKTPLQASFDMTVPVNTSVPVNLNIPVSVQVPVDIAVDQTDLHQSIVGLQGAIEPYKIVMDTAFNSPKEFSLCRDWWSGWMCDIFFGKQ